MNRALLSRGANRTDPHSCLFSVEFSIPIALQKLQEVIQSYSLKKRFDQSLLLPQKVWSVNSASAESLTYSIQSWKTWNFFFANLNRFCRKLDQYFFFGIFPWYFPWFFPNWSHAQFLPTRQLSYITQGAEGHRASSNTHSEKALSTHYHMHELTDAPDSLALL